MNSLANVFTAKFWDVNKPNGSRSLGTYLDSFNFEDILQRILLEDLCEKVYNHSDRMIIENNVIIEKIKINPLICEYSVKFKNLMDDSKITREFHIRIECVKNFGNSNINEEQIPSIYLSNRKIVSKVLKEKKITNWVLNEKSAIKRFLIKVNEVKNLDELKHSMPKATYYRNMKYCKEKGYIINGKLTRKVMV